MKFKMKALLAVIFCIVLVISLVAGCSGTGDKAQDTSKIKVGISFGTLSQEMRIIEKDLMV